MSLHFATLDSILTATQAFYSCFYKLITSHSAHCYTLKRTLNNILIQSDPVTPRPPSSQPFDSSSSMPLLSIYHTHSTAKTMNSRLSNDSPTKLCYFLPSCALTNRLTFTPLMQCQFDDSFLLTGGITNMPIPSS